MGFWEPRRVTYNVVLAGVMIVWIAATWPHFRGAIALQPLAALAVLALLANVCYCAGYLVDFPMQQVVSGAALDRGRAAVWWLGMLLAFVAENYWISDEIYPYVPGR